MDATSILGSRRLRLYGLPVVAVIILTSVTVGALTRDGDTTAGVLLEPASAAGADPFTDPMWSNAPDLVLDRAVAESATAGGTTRSGDEPGLYGGTRDKGWCDADKLNSFLEDNPEKAAAWAEVVGITPDEIESYVAKLTPVVLIADTRVTNHGFREGRATPRQSVLQAGTAVLVDERGVPRVRCACGNPLLAPEPESDESRFEGDRWEGFDPEQIQRIRPAERPVDEFVLVDVRSAERFRRLVGAHVQDLDIPAAGKDGPDEAQLVVTVEGPGQVRSVGAGGIDCGTDCRHVFAAARRVRLHATPDKGAELVGWFGCEAVPTDPAACIAQVKAPTTEVKAVFGSPGQERTPEDSTTTTRGTNPSPGTTTTTTGRARTPGGGEGTPRTTTTDPDIPPPTPTTPPPVSRATVTVRVEGPGSVRVTGDGAAGLEPCTRVCALSFPVGSQVTLASTADGGASFLGFVFCPERADGGLCRFTLRGPTTVEAGFAADQVLSVTVTGGGGVTSADGAIDCAPGRTRSCTARYRYGTTVVLDAIEAGFSRWWEGDCTGFAPTCSVTMTQGRSVAARYVMIG